MKAAKISTLLTLSALALFQAATASAQEADGRRDVATVTGLYVEQAPGLLTGIELARGRDGPLWAEIRHETPQGKGKSELVRIPAGENLSIGDRVVLEESTRTEMSASTGSSAPTRTLPDPRFERPVDGSPIRAPTRPLEVVPGSCIPL
jgi:hypothetical protein